MLFPISKIDEIDWFKKCNGCVDNVSTDTPKECLNCCNCPYAICGSHESQYRKSEVYG